MSFSSRIKNLSQLLIFKSRLNILKVIQQKFIQKLGGGLDTNFHNLPQKVSWLKHQMLAQDPHMHLK